jgi:hypothetical protein
MNSFFRLLLVLSMPGTIAVAQHGLDICREFMPERLMDDAEYRRQMSDVIEAKGAIRPDILWDYILYLRALGADGEQEKLSELRANAYAVENTVRTYRASWMKRQRERLERMNIDNDIRHQVMLVFYQSDKSPGIDSITAMTPIGDDDPRRYYIAWRWIDQASTGPYEAGIDYRAYYESACRDRRSALTVSGNNASEETSKRIDAMIDSIVSQWYLFDDPVDTELPDAADIVFALKKSKLTFVYGGSIVLSTGVTPINPEVYFTSTVDVIGYGPFSVDQRLNSSGQWYVALRYRYAVKEYISPLSYIAVDLMGSVGKSVIDHTLLRREKKEYSLDGRDYSESLYMEWKRIHVSGIQRLLASISIPLMVPLDNVVVEGGIVSGIQRYHVLIDYRYTYVKTEVVPLIGSKWYRILYNEKHSGIGESDKVETVFFPTAVVTWRPFAPMSLQATISTGVWMVRLGIDIF